MRYFYQTILVLIVLLSYQSQAQIIADFEDFDLAKSSFLNQAELGQFDSRGLLLDNDYNPDWDSWSGFAISNIKDSSTPGFLNQYASIAGAGNAGSETYAVSFVLGQSSIEVNKEAMIYSVDGFYVTNSTYAYLSMRDGDAFAKQFGGITGDDPDFFLLTVKGYRDGDLLDSVEVYLADYRFENNDQDYILDEWVYVDLSEMGKPDNVTFELSSSDVGQFGMNTPAYFCLDDAEMTLTASILERKQSKEFNISPNPVSTALHLGNTSQIEMLQIIDSRGNAVISHSTMDIATIISVEHLPKGIYLLRIKDQDGVFVTKIFKE